MNKDSPYHGLVREIWTVREQKIVLNGLMVQEKALEFATATEMVESLVYHSYLMRNIH